jgi:predicted amidophosphoribosyltransferase
MADNQAKECMICAEQVTLISVTACGHHTCSACLAHWLTDHKTCPACRKEIKPGNHLFEQRTITYHLTDS